MVRRVVVTGMGIISSIGNNLEDVTTSLREAKSGIVEAPEFAKMNFGSQVYGAVTNIDLGSIDKRTKRFMGDGRLIPLGYLAMKQAIEDSGFQEVSADNVGLLVGTGGPSTSDQFQSSTALVQNTEGKLPIKVIGMYQVPPTMSSGLSAVLSTLFKIRGVNWSITSACATSSHAIGEAMWMIRSGRQDVVFAGGAEDAHWTKAQGFDAMGALSKKYNTTPAVASRAYDKNRDGFVDAEGSGILVLEELEHAKARGAKIYAEVVGYGATSDGAEMVAPSGEGAVRCMKQAMSLMHKTRIESGTYAKKNSEIDYINTHGTSTPVGDREETEAIREVFGDKIPPISSTKSLTGHSLGAAGVQEAIYSLLMMQEGFLCESAHIEELDPAFADIPIIRRRIDGAKIDTVMSNSFGFGGTNASLIFQRYNG